MANTRNNPIEELDMRFPVRCDSTSSDPSPLHQDNGVAGSESFAAIASWSTEPTRARVIANTTRRGASSADGTASSPGAVRTRHKAEEYLEAKVTASRLPLVKLSSLRVRAPRATVGRSNVHQSSPRGRPRRLRVNRACARRVPVSSSRTNRLWRSTMRRPANYGLAAREPKWPFHDGVLRGPPTRYNPPTSVAGNKEFGLE